MAGENVTRLRPRGKCPECGDAASREFFPFCSNRCKNVDLNRWLSGAYAIPVRDDDAEEQDPSDSPNL